MRIPVPVWQGPAAALLAVVLAADTVQAQAPTDPGTPEATVRRNLSLSQTPTAPAFLPGNRTYSYWGTAPQGFAPSQVPVLAPGLSPYTISNAARSAPTQLSVGVGLGGGFIPPFVTVREATLDNTAHIWLRVPKTAEIWVNGVKTKQTGESRYFFSPPLTPGKQYSYQMRLRWMKDGKPVEETQRLSVQAGLTIHRDFTESR